MCHASHRRFLLLLIFSAAAAGSSAAVTASSDWDPVTMDPPQVDKAHPPASVSLKLDTGGAQVNAMFYLAAGAGPHATVLFLHGRPGNERNFDVAQALRRAGYHVLTMNYRGSWGSGGIYSFRHAVEDALNALTFLRSAEAREKYRVDASRLLLFGYSLGGYAALQAGAQDRSVRAVAALAPVNANQTEVAMRSPAQRSAAFARWRRDIDPDSGPLRVESLEAMVAQPAGYDFLRELGMLRDRQVLLIAGTRDTIVTIPLHHEPIEKSLRRAGAAVETFVLDDDHEFSATRIAVTRAIVNWCRKTVAP